MNGLQQADPDEPADDMRPPFECRCGERFHLCLAKEYHFLREHT